MDKLILLEVQKLSSPFFDAFFITMSRLGEVYFYLPFVAIIYWCADRRAGRRLALAVFFSAMVNAGIKLLVMRSRPIGAEGVRSIYTKSAGGYSFPSGHTQQSTAFWRTLFLLYPQRVLAVVGTFVALLVGLSRIYLGVHWPSDVLGGFILGWLVADGLSYLERKLPPAWLNWAALSLSVLAGVVAIINPVIISSLVCWFFAGAVVGLMLESKRVEEDPAVCSRPVVKILLGFGGLWLVWNLLQLICPITSVRALTAGMWITSGAPWLFRRLKLE